MNDERITAEVISVKPDKVKISIDNIEDFKIAEQELKVGSYLQVSDNEDIILIAIIESFSIDLVDVKKIDENGILEMVTERKYIIEASPLGTIKDGRFSRGGDTLSIPPKKVEPADLKYIKSIFEDSIETEKRFCFSKLASNHEICVPVDGNTFFNKHLAIVGASGSGKSHTTAKIIQSVCNVKNDGVEGLNNSHIIIFDIHGEFSTAFPNANILNVDNLKLPYWLLNGEELEELLLDSGDNNNYNQASVLRKVITSNKQYNNKNISKEKIYFDSPLNFDITQVANCFNNLINETTNSENDLEVKVKTNKQIFRSDEEKLDYFFQEIYEYDKPQRASKDKDGISKGIYNDGKLDKFVFRFKEKINNNRLRFLFDKDLKDITFEEVIRQFISYRDDKKANVTLIDLSGIPFDVLSITVSLISRVLFEYGYYMKRRYGKVNTPLLLVYEEAHKYAPKSSLVKYRASTTSIERIAKEGRKYGVTLAIVSQRPSEVSETIFSQCNSFVAMRLTNPDDQNYVKKLLPDTLGNITEVLPSLQCGEGLLIGESVIIPCIVKIDECSNPPSSSNINYLEEWKKEWQKVNFGELIEEWIK
ncbi:ATP-binding protein [uncultured Clostridium sp.]|uniref:ATP-binding protein n=1 Tax=uncultured Clostridium sp. TaxID=59620 RepID=UPI0032180AD3